MRSSFSGSSKRRNGNPSSDDSSEYESFSSSSYKGSWADKNEAPVKGRVRSGSMSISTTSSKPPPKSATSDDLSLMAKTKSTRHSSSRSFASSGAIPKKGSQFTGQLNQDTNQDIP